MLDPHLVSPRRRATGARVNNRPLAALLGLLAAACGGSLDAAPGPGDDGDPPAGAAAGHTGGRGSVPGPGAAGASSAGPADPTKPNAAAEEGAGPLPLRRLTRREYENTVATLLGDGTGAASAFSPDERNETGFLEPGPVGALDARNYADAAERIAARAVKALDTLLPCKPDAANEAACVRKLVDAFGRRAYRRPLEAGEAMDLMAIYEGAKKDGLDLPTSVGLVMQAVLISPKFLYRWEVAPNQALVVDGKGLVALTPHQVASRLSYFLSGTMPDEALLAEADAGRLGTAAQVTAQARRLLSAPRAAEAFGDFHRMWLKLEGAAGFEDLQKSSKVYPQWTDQARAALRPSFDAFVTDTLLAPGADGKLSSLLLAPALYANEALGTALGITGFKGAAPTGKATGSDERAGLLTQPAFLAIKAATDGSHPSKRGSIVWRDVLCGALGAVPADVPEVEPASDGATTRQRFSKHDESPCASCHTLIDPPGFALEGFDGVGRYRTTESGKPIDASGELTLPSSGQKKPFRTAPEMLRALADSPDARQCVARQWFRYGLGRPEIAADEAALASAGAAATIPELVTKLVASKSFLFRTKDDGEVIR